MEIVNNTLEIIISNTPVFTQAVFKVNSVQEGRLDMEWGMYKIKKENIQKQRFGKKCSLDIRVDTGMIKYTIKW